MLSHNIFVTGTNVGFRRWALRKMYTFEEYIELQTEFLFRGLTDQMQKDNT